MRLFIAAGLAVFLALVGCQKTWQPKITEADRIKSLTTTKISDSQVKVSQTAQGPVTAVPGASIAVTGAFRQSDTTYGSMPVAMQLMGKSKKGDKLVVASSVALPELKGDRASFSATMIMPEEAGTYQLEVLAGKHMIATRDVSVSEK